MDKYYRLTDKNITYMMAIVLNPFMKIEYL